MTTDGVVYVVDDDASVRRALARLIAAAGFEVETFPSARAFLHHPRGDRPACLVLDIRLPGEDGLELQAALGDGQRFLPVIFVTGHGTVPLGVRAMKKGAVDFLQKPVDEAELLGGIQKALEGSRRARVDLVEKVDLESRLDALTIREREVLDLVAIGLLNKQIGEHLGMAEKTVKVHRGRMMQKMAAASVAELVRMLHKLGREAATPPGDLGRRTKGP